ncbi:hypothetical protein Poli38472_011627 [Pythium oligandrum]|uniref:ENTH domain-containing protein n=1 Tax=Pythium oligandrum TaxID=41045 RepID=A0A8K1CJR9_PYTOL|nr:hypothetical protein Poli38472_011627 [Pythium oligandrum]|eukprot:TMW64747.1 hypothetical protein Poli38472_011627 [Pythium oligandrum]
MDRLRAAIDEFVDKVKEAIQGEPKSPVEILLDQHLSLEEELISFSPKNCTAVAIPTMSMHDFAARTRNIVDYPFIMERIWEILIDYQHDPTLMRKALNLLHHLLVNGSIQVMKDCQDSPRISFLQNLVDDYNRFEFEQYQFSQHLDVGAGVRKTAAEIVNYLVNERELFYARREAEKLQQSLSERGLRPPLSPKHGQSGHSTTSSFRSEERRPPQYADSFYRSSAWDDIGSHIITHPDEMFEEPETRGTRPHPRSQPSREDMRTQSLPKKTPEQRRRSERREGQREGSEAAKRAMTDSVDLLGLDLITLDDTPQQSYQSACRTQSDRLPQKFTATI